MKTTEAGVRVDKWLSGWTELSRNRIQQLIDQDAVREDGNLISYAGFAGCDSTLGSHLHNLLIRCSLILFRRHLHVKTKNRIFCPIFCISCYIAAHIAV